ncbi:MAG: hypothetical protein IT581_10165 [Verrucomicrobiales bacterium]|nr:hypothetical protein [Verrucomicrobiales bacterium]
MRLGIQLVLGVLWVCLFAGGCTLSRCGLARIGVVQISRLMADRSKVAELLKSNSALTDWLQEEFSIPVAGYRLVWSDEVPASGAPAEHARYERDKLLVIRVDPSLLPVDQVLGCLFECANCRQVTKFIAIEDQAKRGCISKTDFVDEFLRVEHEQVVLLKEKFFRVYPVAPAELAETRLCRSLQEAPSDYREFRRWRSEQPSGRRAITRYEEYFEWLTKDSGANAGHGNIRKGTGVRH